MGTMISVIGLALVMSLIVFWFCEEKSLKNADMSDMKCLIKEEKNVSECFEEYNTIQYVFYYFVTVFILGLIMANNVLLPNQFGLVEAMAYTFIPSMIGSLIILLVKWRFQPMIKLLSSFIFGAGYIGATAIALAFAYVVNG